jgi:hypothetical protein
LVAVKVVPAYYVPAEEESLEAWLALAASPPLYNNSATDGEITMNVSSIEDANTGSSPARASAVAASKKRLQNWMSASRTLWRSKQSLGSVICLKHSQVTINTLLWDNGAVIRGGLTKLSKEGRGMPRNNKLSKAMKPLENAGFEWNHCKPIKAKCVEEQQ